MGRTPPHATGLYDPRNEHDACGVGMVAHIKGRKSHAIVTQALEILANLDHRGAVGADPLLGDGAGILLQIPDPLFRKWAQSEGKELPAPGDYAVAMCFLPPADQAFDFVTEQLEEVSTMSTLLDTIKHAGDQLLLVEDLVRRGEIGHDHETA